MAVLASPDVEVRRRPLLKTVRYNSSDLDVGRRPRRPVTS